MRTKLKALTADIYRVRVHKSSWNVYRTARGWVLNMGKVYRYYNTGEPFHKKAKSIVDIRGEVSVETEYKPRKGRLVYTNNFWYDIHTASVRRRRMEHAKQKG